jgi:hypothetical protein
MYIDSRNMVFFRFGTLAEVLDHLEDDMVEWLARNYFTAILSCGTCDVAPFIVFFVAKLQQGVSIGAGSLVFDCTLNSSVQIGVRYVVTWVHCNNQSKPSKHVLLDSLPLGGANFKWTNGFLEGLIDVLWPLFKRFYSSVIY